MAAADVAHLPKMSWLTVPPQLLGRQSTMDFDLETDLLLVLLEALVQLVAFYCRHHRSHGDRISSANCRLIHMCTVTDALFLLVTLVHHQYRSVVSTTRVWISRLCRCNQLGLASAKGDLGFACASRASESSWIVCPYTLNISVNICLYSYAMLCDYINYFSDIMYPIDL